MLSISVNKKKHPEYCEKKKSKTKKCKIKLTKAFNNEKIWLKKFKQLNGHYYKTVNKQNDEKSVKKRSVMLSL